MYKRQIQLPADIRVQGNSLIQVGQNLGGSIGTAVYTVILGTMGVVGGMPVALTVSIVTAAAALVFALRLKKLDQDLSLIHIYPKAGTTTNRSGASAARTILCCW